MLIRKVHATHHTWRSLFPIKSGLQPIGPSSRTLYIVLGALFGALLFVSQVIAASLPNIELVSLLILVWTRVYRYGALPGIGVFILLQGLFYGFGIWWESYLYIWFILWGLVMLVPQPKNEPSPIISALGSGCVQAVHSTIAAISTAKTRELLRKSFVCFILCFPFF